MSQHIASSCYMLDTDTATPLQVIMASYAEDEIQTRYYLTPFAVKAATEYKSECSFDIRLFSKQPYVGCILQSICI